MRKKSLAALMSIMFQDLHQKFRRLKSVAACGEREIENFLSGPGSVPTDVLSGLAWLLGATKGHLDQIETLINNLYDCADLEELEDAVSELASHSGRTNRNWKAIGSMLYHDDETYGVAQIAYAVAAAFGQVASISSNIRLNCLSALDGKATPPAIKFAKRKVKAQS